MGMTSNKEIFYSAIYADKIYEYRHVILPTDVFKGIPRDRLLSESEWKAAGVRQGGDWEHFMLHRPEPHILLFRRLLPPPKVEPSSHPRSRGIKRKAP